MDELALLQRYAKHRDESAFVAIVERYLGKLYGTAYRRTGDRLLAEEIVQDVFTALAKKASSMEADTVLACWLHRAVVLRAAHLMRTEYRRQRKMQSYSDEHPENEELVDPVIGDDTKRILDQAIDELDPQDRKLVLLRYFEDLTVRDIADRLGISKSTAQRQAERALEKLSALLKRRDIVMPVSTLAAVLSSQFAKAAPSSLVATAVSQNALQASTTASLTPTLLIMTKTPFLVAAGGLLIAISTMGGIQLGKSQALARRTSMIQGAATTSETSPTPTAALSVPAEPVEPVADIDPMAKLIAQILKLAKDDTVDPKSGALQAVLGQLDAHELPEAFAHRNKLVNDRDRSILGGMLLMRWSQLDGHAATKALFDHAEKGDLKWYPNVVASTWAESDPSAALAWERTSKQAETLPHETRRQMLIEIFRQWAGQDREAALKALADLSYDTQKSAVWGFSRDGAETREILDQIGGDAK